MQKLKNFFNSLKNGNRSAIGTVMAVLVLTVLVASFQNFSYPGKIMSPMSIIGDGGGGGGIPPRPSPTPIKCQKLTCPVLATGCTYGGKPKDVNGCVTSCGQVTCAAGVKYSRDWTAVSNALFAVAANDRTLIVLARNSGLTVTVTHGTLAAEYRVQFTDPVTKGPVMVALKQGNIVFSNVNTSVLAKGGTGNVCNIDGVYFNMHDPSTFGGAATIDSVLTPGLTNVNLVMTPIANGSTPTGITAATMAASCQTAATSLQNQIGSGLTFTCSTGDLPLFAPPVGSIYFSCGGTRDMFNFGNSTAAGQTVTVTSFILHRVSAYVSENCFALLPGELTNGAPLQHEFTHGLGFTHDPGSNNMDDDSRNLSFSNTNLPPGAVQAIKDITSKTNVTIDAAKNCMTLDQWTKQQCAKNKNFDPSCGDLPGPSPVPQCTNVCAPNQNLDSMCRCISGSSCTSCLCSNGVPITCYAPGCTPTQNQFLACSNPTMLPSPQPSPTPLVCACTCSGINGGNGTYSCDNASCPQQGQTCTPAPPSCSCSCVPQGYLDCTPTGDTDTCTYQDQPCTYTPPPTSDSSSDSGYGGGYGGDGGDGGGGDGGSNSGY